MHVHTYAPVADAAVMCSRRFGLATFGKRLATHNQLNLLITREILRLGLATFRKRLATHNQLNLLITREHFLELCGYSSFTGLFGKSLPVPGNSGLTGKGQKLVFSDSSKNVTIKRLNVTATPSIL